MLNNTIYVFGLVYIFSKTYEFMIDKEYITDYCTDEFSFDFVNNIFAYTQFKSDMKSCFNHGKNIDIMLFFVVYLFRILTMIFIAIALIKDIIAPILKKYKIKISSVIIHILIGLIINGLIYIYLY